MYATLTEARTREEIDAAKCNVQFENYYKTLGILKEEEWDVFYATLKAPLDICFRVNSIDKHKQRTLTILQEKIDKIPGKCVSLIPAVDPWTYENEMAHPASDKLAP